jgi:hypothetical protein
MAGHFLGLPYSQVSAYIAVNFAVFDQPTLMGAVAKL